MTGRGHSPLGMSVLHRRAGCPGSMRMERGRPDRSTPEAARGTGLHEAAAQALKEGLGADDVLPGDQAGQDVIAPWLGLVRAKETELGAKAMVEAHFSLEALHDLYWGTTDAAIIAPPVLWIGDLKSGGWRVQVRYADGHVNFQVGGYALGALQLVPPGVAIERIEVTICQPRNGGISSAVMSMDEVLDFAGEMLEIAEAAEAPDAPLIPGDHCQFCKASSDCPALRAGAYEAADIEFGGPPTPSEMTPEAMGKVLENAELIDLWIHAVRQRAKDDADRGVRIPGWKLVQRRGIRRWVDTDHAAASCMTYGLRGDALFEPAKLRSPAQVEKAFKAEKLTLPRDWSELVVTSDPGTALVPEADVRPAIDATPSADFATPKQEAW